MNIWASLVFSNLRVTIQSAEAPEALFIFVFLTHLQFLNNGISTASVSFPLCEHFHNMLLVLPYHLNWPLNGLELLKTILKHLKIE